MKTNSKREHIFKRLDEGASPMTIYREFSDRLEACSWNYICKLRREREDRIDIEIAHKRLAEFDATT